jgi:hypothetical protein
MSIQIGSSQAKELQLHMQKRAAENICCIQVS